MRKARYKTLVDYMERTGTHAAALREKVFKETGVMISPAMFSYILSGGRRCSAWNADAIHRVTGVPIKELMRWPRYAKPENSKAVA